MARGREDPFTARGREDPFTAAGHTELHRLRRRISELEEELERRSTNFTGRLLDNVTEAVIATDDRGRIRYWNRGAESLYRYSAPQAVGRIYAELIEPTAEANTQARGRERKHRRQDGTTLWVEIIESSYVHPNGTAGIIYIARRGRGPAHDDGAGSQPSELRRRPQNVGPGREDLEYVRTAALAEAVEQLSVQVAERERAEAETDQFFRICPSLMMVVRFDGIVERVNPAMARHVGYEPNDMAGRKLVDFVHPEDASSISEQLTLATGGHSILGHQVRTVARDGRVRWIELSGAGDHARKIIFFSGVDVTTRQETEGRLRDAEQRFRELAENVSEVFWLADADLRRILYASPAFEALWGRRVSDLVHDRCTWIDAIHPDDRTRTEQAFQHLVDEGDMDVEYRIIRPDGSLRWIHDRGYPVMSEQGAVTRVAGIASDITQRKQAQEALQAVALGTASASTGDLFFQTLMHHTATALKADDAWLTEPGNAPDQIRVLGWWSEGRPRTDKTLTSTMLPCLEVIAGSPRWVAHGVRRSHSHTLLKNREAYMAMPVADSTGRVLGVISVARNEPLEDLAMVDSILQIFAARAAAELERLRAEARAWQREEELAHVGRLQTMGEMASGIAHELNQPLLAIMGHAEAARLGLSAEARVTIESDLNDIEVQAERAAAIIQRLRSFVQRHPPEWAEVDINALVRDVLRFVSLQAKRLRASILSQLDPELPFALADRVLLEQVLVNLINNALEAMEDLPEDERVVTIRTETRRSAIMIAVEDEGPGLAAVNPFAPFVSTKSGGLGIGLSISRSIIERHRGYLWHEPRQPRGCRFTFRLPIEPPEPETALTAEDPSDR